MGSKLSITLLALAALTTVAQAQDKSSDIIARGEYLARAGDCTACHTAPEGRLFAGGRAMPTPFGTLYTSNITPDPETGIGRWSADDFYKTMHSGRFPDGGLIYPAMPFASYTKVTRADSDAIFAYLRSIPPVDQKNRPHDLRFPYDNRQLILGWRTLYFREGEFKPDPTKSAEWNRGAYLVEGLGHCSMCHSPINALGGTSKSDAFKGGLIPMQNWYAPSLTSNREAGLGDWSIKDITDLLQTGVSARGVVYGPMAEVVHNSLQYLSDEDTRAMAVYLKGISEPSPPPPASSALPTTESSLLISLQDRLRQELCELSRHAGRRQAAALAAARQQPVDRDGVGGEPDPHGAQWWLSAGHQGQPDALWHAALRRAPLRQRGRRRRFLHPHRLGQSRHAGLGARGQRAALRAAELRDVMINSDPPTSPAAADQAVEEVVAQGPSGALVLAGIATACVVAMWLAFYLFVFLPRGPLQ
ncbi:mono/diheme cytochrome c family protein [Bradyrhizobium sacchari]|uniref:Mono/diheme cytochrome c family protein n=2 Tax=Bradyrhizobium sacchari TaxID=1399419 RepID=A0A560KKU2_9BRAD|nr:mono/diheme cytochrome c family protein [Bradyrhizobium sacchari]